MIPRTLVPFSLLPSAVAADERAGARSSTRLDARIIVPPDLPVTPLDAKSSIPAHVPLEVLGQRILVPRDMPVTPLARPRESAPPPPASVLDSRVTIPHDARPVEFKPQAPVSHAPPADIVEPDIITTGEVNLMTRPIADGRVGWGWQSTVSSILFHGAFVALLLLQPKLFPYRPPTEKEVEMAHRSLGLVYLPPPPVNALPVAPAPPAPKIRIDPRVFQMVAPPEVEASPTPGPGGTNAPKEQARATPEPGTREEPLRPEPQRDVARFEPLKPPEPSAGLQLKQSSPGRMLQDSMRGAARGGPATGMEFGDALPGVPGGIAGAGRGYAGGAVQILTPTEGVDFTYYIARMLASVRRNWYAVIPESARLGERGVVVLDFAVLRNGGVQPGHPELMRTSGREPMDRAAISAIQASNPFEPLPPAFSGPSVKFRFIFLYNMRLEQQ